jgi:hypothetical protein
MTGPLPCGPQAGKEDLNHEKHEKHEPGLRHEAAFPGHGAASPHPVRAFRVFRGRILRFD